MANCLPVALGGRGLLTTRWAKRFFSFASLNEEAAYRRSYSYFDPAALDRLTGHSLTSAIDSIITHHAECYARGGDAPTRAGQIRRMGITDLQMFLPSLNLAYTDRASMAMSTEVRTPYVDLRVVDAAFRLNSDGHLRRGVQKIYLKEAAERWLDRDIIHRPKANFGLPLRAWTRRQLRERLYDLLPNGQLVQDGWLDGREVGNLLKLNTDGTEDLAQAIWHLMTLEMWYRREQERPHA
jgi:asparagine synthase (glutamine-hydrolysing)